MSDLLALAMAGLIGIGAVLLIIYTTHTIRETARVHSDLRQATRRLHQAADRAEARLRDVTGDE